MRYIKKFCFNELSQKECCKTFTKTILTKISCNLEKKLPLMNEYFKIK